MTIRHVSVPAVATLALLLGGCGALGGDDQSPTASDTRKTKKPSKGNQSDSPAPTESSSSAAPTGETVAVPVYFVGETPQGPRLYREFRSVDAADPLGAAVALLTSGDTLDPDYRSLFPGGAFSSVRYDDAAGLLIASVPDDGWMTRAGGMSAAYAELAVQSLVYTMQGAAQTRAPLKVTIGDGSDGVPLFGVDTADGVRNEPQLDVLAMVNVTTPEEGAVVGDTFIASGVASSFEATVPWQIEQDGRVVADGFATAEGWMDKLYPWETEVDVSGLPAGTYTFIAMTDDPSGGEGGGPTEDTKTFIVE